MFKYPSNPAEAIKNYGISVYFILDLKSTVFGGNIEEFSTGQLEYEETPPSKSRDIDDTLWNSVIEKTTDKSLLTLHNYYKNRTITEKNDYTGLFKDKNLIMIMMESISFAVVDEKYKVLSNENFKNKGDLQNISNLVDSSKVLIDKNTKKIEDIINNEKDKDIKNNEQKEKDNIIMEIHFCNCNSFFSWRILFSWKTNQYIF